MLVFPGLALVLVGMFTIRREASFLCPPPGPEWLTLLLLLDSLCCGCQHPCCAFCRPHLLPVCPHWFCFPAATAVVVLSLACCTGLVIVPTATVISCNHWAVSVARRKGFHFSDSLRSSFTKWMTIVLRDLSYPHPPNGLMVSTPLDSTCTCSLRPESGLMSRSIPIFLGPFPPQNLGQPFYSPKGSESEDPDLALLLCYFRESVLLAKFPGFLRQIGL